MPGTRQPQGLIIERNNVHYTLSWKIGDTDYNAGQQFRWRYRTHNGKWTGWTTWGQAVDETSRTVTFSAANFYPNKNVRIITIEMQVRGKRGNTSQDGKTTVYDWSWWSSKTMDLYCPQIPNVESVRLDDTYDNRSHFSWVEPNAFPHDTEPTNRNPYQSLEWQSILVKECNETDGSKLPWRKTQLGWRTGTSGAASGSLYFTEESDLLAKNSYTRWVRFRARGPGYGGWSQGAKNTGCSYWRYAKHVFAMPNVATIRKAIREGTLPWIRVTWYVGYPASHPIDEVTVEYTVGVPAAGLAPQPSASWTTVRTFYDGGGDDEASFLLPDYQRLDFDNMVWVRIGTKHDRNYRATGAVRVMNGSVPYNGGLTPPSGLSVTNINTENHRADIHAENNSAVPDSKIAIVFRQTGFADMVVGYLNHGQTDVTVRCPDWGTSSFTFAVYAFQGSATATTSRGVTAYTIAANLKSSTVTAGGNVPMPPTNITAVQGSNETEALLSWSWSWSAGTIGMEISWSQNQNAWESTDQPQTFIVSDINAGKWRVAGLSAGVWYFRLRQTRENGDAVSYGPYSDIVELTLNPVQVSEEEEVLLPVLSFSTNVISAGGEFTAFWAYEDGSGSVQTYAELCEATVENNVVTYGTIIKHVTTDQHAVIAVPSTWTTGTSHFLCVRVDLEGAEPSGWSVPTAITIADPVTCSIVNTSLVTRTIVKDQSEHEATVLTELPLTVTVTGAAEESVNISIVRAADYHISRPNGDTFDGYEGETVYSHVQNGGDAAYTKTQDVEIDPEKEYYVRTGSGTEESPYTYSLVDEPVESDLDLYYEYLGSSYVVATITPNDLVGYLDDGAFYRLIATVTDSLGQVASDEINFEVHWAHQALMPNGTVEILSDYGVAKLTPTAPVEAINTDVCDIYRLSVDKPELVFQNATFGESYVDPYPTIGEFGGYRFVFKTANGDYITEDDVIAWVDKPSNFESIDHIIDFNGEQVNLRYNVSLANTWSKDFQETKYLGGSVQGDWNAGVHRTGSITAVSVIETDQDTIAALRRLAVYDGVCHVRTRDGSSYDADVEVSENRGYEPSDLVANFSISVTRVDPEGLAGVPYDLWHNSLG